MGIARLCQHLHPRCSSHPSNAHACDLLLFTNPLRSDILPNWVRYTDTCRVLESRLPLADARLPNAALLSPHSPVLACDTAAPHSTPEVASGPSASAVSKRPPLLFSLSSSLHPHSILTAPPQRLFSTTRNSTHNICHHHHAHAILSLCRRPGISISRSRRFVLVSNTLHFTFG